MPKISSKSEKNKKAKNKRTRDPRAPKKPPTPVSLFIKENRFQVKQAYPGLKAQEIQEFLNKRWKTASQQVKQIYKDRQRELQKIYEIELKNFKGNGESDEEEEEKEEEEEGEEKEDENDQNDENKEDEEESNPDQQPQLQMQSIQEFQQIHPIQTFQTFQPIQLFVDPQKFQSTTSTSTSKTRTNTTTTKLPEKKKEKRKRQASTSSPSSSSNLISRPPLSYFVFCALNRAEIKERNPQLSPPNVAKRLGEIWESLPEEEIKKYEALAISKKAEFQNEFEESLNPAFRTEQEGE